MAGLYNIVCQQGATFQFRCTIRIDGVLLDLTGYTARLIARASRSAPPILDASSEGASPAITLGGAAGTITVLVASTTTVDMPPGTVSYNLEITAPNAIVTRLLEGTFQVTEDVGG